MYCKLMSVVCLAYNKLENLRVFSPTWDGPTLLFLILGATFIKVKYSGKGPSLAADGWHDLKITIMQTKDSFDIVAAITEIKVHLGC